MHEDLDPLVVRVPKKGVYIGRPSIFGNPFQIGQDGSRSEVIAKYREYFYDRVRRDRQFAEAIEGLRGNDLACHCAPLPCHGDVIIEYLRDH